MTTIYTPTDHLSRMPSARELSEANRVADENARLQRLQAELTALAAGLGPNEAAKRAAAANLAPLTRAQAARMTVAEKIAAVERIIEALKYKEPTMTYIATDHDLTAIYGIGETADAAIAEAREESREPEADFLAIEATPRLIAKVEADGGCGFAWRVISRYSSRPTVPTSMNAVADLED